MSQDKELDQLDVAISSLRKEGFFEKVRQYRITVTRLKDDVMRFHIARIPLVPDEEEIIYIDSHCRVLDSPLK